VIEFVAELHGLQAAIAAGAITIAIITIIIIVIFTIINIIIVVDVIIIITTTTVLIIIVRQLVEQLGTGADSKDVLIEVVICHQHMKWQ
jgi:hypothetical protein